MATLALAIQATKATQGASQFVNATVQVKTAAGSLSSALGGLQRSVDNVGQTASAVGRVMAGLFAGYTLIQGVREAIKTYAQFEQTLASLKGVLGATEQQMIGMKNAALEMGASSRSSANQSAEALLILSKAGFTAAQSVQALPGVLALATAHQLDLGAASDYTANILNQFKLSTDQTNRAVDVLSTTANKSLADVRDLAEAMKYAGPAAGALGISIEEAAAAAGVLSDRGIKASLAGTNLRGIMVDLIAPTAKARQTLEEIGLTVKDVDVRSVGFTGALKNLAKAGAGVDDLARIFGVMQVSGATALVQNINRLEQLTAANKEAAGSTQLLVDIMQDTLMGRFKELINVIGVAIIKVGDSGLGKSLKDLLVEVADGIRLLTGFDDQLKGTGDSGQRTAVVLRSLAVVVGALTGAGLLSWMININRQLAITLFTVDALTVRVALLSSALVGLAAFDFGSYLYNEFKSIRTLGDELATIFQTAGSSMEYYWDVAIITLKGMWNDFVNYVREKFTILSGEIIGPLMNVISPGTGTAFQIAVNSGPVSYDKAGALAAASQARSNRDMDIAAAAAAVSANREKEFGGKDRLTGQGYASVAGNSLAELSKTIEGQIKSWSDMTQAVNGTVEAIEELPSVVDDYEARAKDSSIFSESAHNRVLELTAAIEDESEALRRSQRERNVLIKVTQFQALAEEAYGLSTERTIKAIDDYTEAVNRLEDARADRKVNEKLRSLDDERKSLFLTNKERIVAVEVAKFHAEAEDMYGRNSIKAAQATDLYRGKLEKLVELEELRSLADNIGDEFGQAFTDMVLGAKSATDAIEGLTKAIIEMVFQQMVAKQISGWISTGIMGAFGGASAKGNVFNNGAYVAFAKGGIVSGPQTFAMSGGRTGLMGENGPEAIMPLRRSASGNLGVEVTGHATKVLNASVVVNANNPDEYRGSEQQMARKLRSMMSRL